MKRHAMKRHAMKPLALEIRAVARQIRFEALEDRRLLTTTVFLDFGQGFPSGGLNMTVQELRDINGAGLSATRTTGPNLSLAAPNGNSQALTDNLRLRPLAGVVTADVLAVVRRTFEPFDIDVQLASASSIADVQASLNANGTGQGNRDAYVFITEVFNTTTSVDVGDDMGLSGRAAGLDIGGAPANGVYAENLSDEAVIVFADTIGADALELGNTASHEAAHTFGMAHTDANNDISGGDIIRAGGGSLFDNGAPQVVTRFDLPVPELMTDANPYLELANDPNIGLKTGAPAFVTGTGLFDVIEITSSGANTATVIVDVFTDDSLSTGVSTSIYSINTSNGVLVNPSFGGGRVVIDGNLGADVHVQAHTGDTTVELAPGSVSSVVYTPGSDKKGIVTGRESLKGTLTAGATTITFDNFDASDDILVHDVINLSYITPSAPGADGSDFLTVGAPFGGLPGQLWISGISDLVSPDPEVGHVPLTFSQVANVTVNTGANDGAVGSDSIRVVNTQGGGLKNLTIISGSGDDAVRLETGDWSLPVSGGDFVWAAGDGLDTVVAAADVDQTLDDDTLNSASGGSLQFSGVERGFLIGGASGNVLDASAFTLGPVLLAGLDGNDVLRGGAGDDFLFGSGKDLHPDDFFADPFGGASQFSTSGDGKDTLSGGAGSDLLAGEGDGDTYELSDAAGSPETDVIFEEATASGADTVDASGLATPAMSTNQLGVSLLTQGARTVNVQAAGQQQNIEFGFNVDPLLDVIVGPAIAVPFQPLMYAVDFFDVGTMMTHSSTVDWEDGAPEAAVVAQPTSNGEITASHAYASTGVRTITIDVTDQLGNTTSASKEVETLTAALAPDPDRPGKTALFVGGTATHDAVALTPLFPPTEILVIVNGVNEGVFAPDGGIYVYTDGGHDSVQLGYAIENPAFVDAGDGNDVVLGAMGNDVLLGGAGIDTLFGLDGDDVLVGGHGNDVLFGGWGDDLLNGGAGADILYGEWGQDVLLGGGGADYLYGGFGDDQLNGGAGADFLFGEDGDDNLHGGSGADYLYGGLGDDELFGGAGDDWLFGQPGNDHLDGGDDFDWLFGEAGVDTLVNGEMSFQ